MFSTRADSSVIADFISAASIIIIVLRRASCVMRRTKYAILNTQYANFIPQISNIRNPLIELIKYWRMSELANQFIRYVQINAY